MRTRPLLVVLLLAGFVVPMVAGPAAASCVGPQGSLKSRLRESRYVFEGTVTATEARGRLARVDVDRVWRGKVAAKVTVVGGTTQSRAVTSVDRSYKADQKYLFVSYKRTGDRYRDNSCTDTREWSPKLAKLRPKSARLVGNTPADTATETISEAAAPPVVSDTVAGPGRNPLLYVLVIALVVVGAGVLYASRTRD